MDQIRRPGNNPVRRPVKSDDEHLGKIIKQDLRDMVREIAEEFWLVAVGIGALVTLAAIGLLIWGMRIESPETVSIFGVPRTCSEVLDGASTLGGKLATTFSSQAKRAKDTCQAAQAKPPILIIGSLLLLIAIPWTAGFGYFGYHYEREKG